MTEYLKRSWAVVDLDGIAHNIREIKGLLAPGCKLMGVVKADAYGHGDLPVARLLAEQGVDWLGVSNINEALSLRAGGISLPILIFGFTPEEYAAALCEHRLTQAVYSREYAGRLQREAAEAGVIVDIHIKADTGMSRLGFVEDNGFSAADGIFAACNMKNLNPCGIFTHFAVADELCEESKAFTRLQYERFCALIDELRERGVTFPLRHCCNSGGVINYPDMHMDMVRPGIITYGLSPSEDCANISKLDLHPAMELYSVISQVKELEPGATVSYGRKYKADEIVRVATVPIGYADGYSRLLSGRGRALIRGRFAKVIGRVCMDMMMLDVTHIPDAAPGDTVTIVGRDGENALTFDEMAELSGTISYEKVCLVGKRVPRVYRRAGQELCGNNP